MPTEDPLVIVQDEPSKYHFKTKDDQRVGIEHRNQYIVLSLFKWGEEGSLEISLNVALSNNLEFLENRIELETSATKLTVYPIDTRSTGDLYGDSEDQIQCHDGGARFELVLKVKPPVNSFTVPVVAKNLRFSHQPFLTQDEIGAGARRPLNVEDSYAVYHISKKNNQYRTGKAFHIFRPIAEDALGVKAWCSIQFDKYIDPTSLTLTIPQQFLDEATYPVTIDPDFGYQIPGGSSQTITEDGKTPAEYRAGSALTMLAPGGTANYIRAYVVGDVASDCKVFINQKDSGGAGTHGQIATKENLACAAAIHWEEFTLSSEILTQAVDYILNITANDDDLVGPGDSYNVRYDLDGAVDSYIDSQNYAAPESPWVVPAAATTRDYSIYCNYTDAVAGWTGKISGVTNPAEIAGVPVANIASVKGVAAGGTMTFKAPTACDGGWTNCANAEVDNPDYAEATTDAQQGVWEGYGFALDPDPVNYVWVRIKHHTLDDTKHSISLEVWNGSEWGPPHSVPATETPCTEDIIDVTGDFSWTSEMVDAIKVRLTANIGGGAGASKKVMCCYLPVEVDH